MLPTDDTAEAVTLSNAWPAANALSWQAAVVTAYRHAERTTIDRLRRELASRILELIGQSVEAGAIHVNAGTRTATVAVRDVVFQLRHAELLLVRRCVHCGVGHFTSSTVEDAADLGYALIVWEPRCAGCALDDEDWTHSF